MLKSGVIITTVEYIKQPETQLEPLRTAIVQAGADLLMRACYNPSHNSHRISVYDSTGSELTSEKRKVVMHNIAGPLCFAGDYVKKGVRLPSLEEGDIVVIRDCGANTLSTFSRHCSRLAPPVYSYTRDEASGILLVKLEVEGEKHEDMLEFWNRAPPSLSPPPPPPTPPERRDTCLLVVDVQPEYWKHADEIRRDFPDFPANLSRTLAACRSQKNAVVWIRADYRDDVSPWLPQFRDLNPGKGGIIPLKEKSEWEDFAQPAKEEVVVGKPSWGIKDTELLDLLKLRCVKNVLLCGLITSVCVQQTAFGVFEAGFKTTLVEDACADRGKERHDAAIGLYGGYLYHVTTSSEIEKT